MFTCNLYFHLSDGLTALSYLIFQESTEGVTNDSAVPSANRGTISHVAPLEAVTEADGENTISEVGPILDDTFHRSPQEAVTKSHIEKTISQDYHILGGTVPPSPVASVVASAYSTLADPITEVQDKDNEPEAEVQDKEPAGEHMDKEPKDNHEDKKSEDEHHQDKEQVVDEGVVAPGKEMLVTADAAASDICAPSSPALEEGKNP